MILKDYRHDLGTTTVELYTFEIECDKCKATASFTMPTHEQTQRAAYEFGWRANFRARKYVHLCGRCEAKRRAKR